MPEEEKVLRDPETGKFKPKNKEVIFASKFYNQTVMIEPTQFASRNSRGSKGKKIEFTNGVYRTSDPFEIKALKSLAERPTPARKITIVQDIV